MDFCREFWDGVTGNDEPRWDEFVVDTVAPAELVLAKALGTVLAAHRKDHGLTASKKDQAKAIRTLSIFPSTDKVVSPFYSLLPALTTPQQKLRNSIY